jgi:hypothetical protein
MTDIRKQAVIEIAEIIDPMAWIRMRHHIDTPRFGRRRQRSIEKARSILIELARREPGWRSGLTVMLRRKDGGRVKQEVRDGAQR